MMKRSNGEGALVKPTLRLLYSRDVHLTHARTEASMLDLSLISLSSHDSIRKLKTSHYHCRVLVTSELGK